MGLVKNKRVGGRCYWCGMEVFPVSIVGVAHSNLRTVDHIRSKPECVSGYEYHHRDNKVTACFSCNQRRSLEWCQRRDAGLIHPTAWSIKEAQREREWEHQKKERKRLRQEREEFLKNCKPCRFINIEVPAELEEAYQNVGA